MNRANARAIGEIRDSMARPGTRSRIAPSAPCVRGLLGYRSAAALPFYRGDFSGADNCSVRSRSVMSTTVSIGAVSS